LSWRREEEEGEERAKDNLDAAGCGEKDKAVLGCVWRGVEGKRGRDGGVA
jgi:hypothetical protein